MKVRNKYPLILMTLLISEGITDYNSSTSNPHLISIQEESIRDAIQKKETIEKNEMEFGGSLFVKRIIDGDFFREKFSTKQDYTLVIRHCSSHTGGQYDETFTDGLSQILIKYPRRIKGI